jgi:hypothetical protein
MRSAPAPPLKALTVGVLVWALSSSLPAPPVMFSTLVPTLSASRVRNAAPRIDPDDLEHLLDRAASELEALAAPPRTTGHNPPGATFT